MGGNAFIPRFRNLSKDEKRNFIKGYCVGISSGGSASPNYFPLYGDELQAKLIAMQTHACRAAFSASV